MDLDALVRTHVRVIELCNQRGGRMLSVVDLMAAGTLPRPVAIYALAAIGAGASFMVGAQPGGAGKTTVMGALLNLAPPDVLLTTADSLDEIERGLRERVPRRCFVGHEIGPGRWYGYLWGSLLRRYFELPTAGHMLATNLHADTVEEARKQICEQNGVSVNAFLRMHLLFFLQVDWGPPIRRRVVSIWESDGNTPHICIGRDPFDTDMSRRSRWVTPERACAAERKLDQILRAGARTIEEVRIRLLEPAPGFEPGTH